MLLLKGGQTFPTLPMLQHLLKPVTPIELSDTPRLEPEHVKQRRRTSGHGPVEWLLLALLLHGALTIITV